MCDVFELNEMSISKCAGSKRRAVVGSGTTAEFLDVAARSANAIATMQQNGVVHRISYDANEDDTPVETRGRARPLSPSRILLPP